MLKIQEYRPDIKSLDEFRDLVSKAMKLVQAPADRFTWGNEMMPFDKYKQYEQELLEVVTIGLLTSSGSVFEEAEALFNRYKEENSLNVRDKIYEKAIETPISKEFHAVLIEACAKTRMPSIVHLERSQELYDLINNILVNFKNRAELKSLYPESSKVTPRAEDDYIISTDVVSRSYRYFTENDFFDPSFSFDDYSKCFNLIVESPQHPIFRQGKQVKFVYFLTQIEGMKEKTALKRFGIKQYSQTKSRGKNTGWKSLCPVEKNKIDRLFK